MVADLLTFHPYHVSDQLTSQYGYRTFLPWFGGKHCLKQCLKPLYIDQMSCIWCEFWQLKLFIDPPSNTHCEISIAFSAPVLVTK